MNSEDLETRILALLDGELPPEETAGLEAALLADEQALATYEQLVLLHNALESRFEGASAARGVSLVSVDRLISTQRKRIVSFSLTAAAAVLLISGFVMWMILAPRPAASIGSIRTSADASFSLVHRSDAGSPGSRLLAEGTIIHLDRGRLEGEFLSGVRLVAEAPGRLQVLSGNRVRLEHGTSWFHVPPAAAGFAVETAGLTVVDLGTKFGVVAAEDGREEVHVMDGRVEVNLRKGDSPATILAGGAAVALGRDGRLREIPSDASLFETQLESTREIPIANHSFEADVIPRDGDRSTWESGYDDYNKELLPAGWLGFDDGDGGTEGTRGVLSTAPDSYFHDSLAATPDADANDQMFYSAARDIYQVLAEPVMPGRTYTLRVDIGDRMASGQTGAPGNPGFRLGIGTEPGERLLEPASTDFPAQIDGGWVTWSATYVTGPEVNGGEPLRIELTSGSRVGWFDNVRLSVTR